MGKIIKPRFLGSQNGFGLLEALIAVAILGVIGVTFISAIDAGYRSVDVLDQKVVGLNLAVTHIEHIREAEYAEDYSSVVTGIVLPSPYERNIYLEFSEDGEIWTETYSDQTLQRIIVSISRGGKPVYSICTYKWK